MARSVLVRRHEAGSAEGIRMSATQLGERHDWTGLALAARRLLVASPELETAFLVFGLVH